ncbi:hypothetical protein SAMN02949497_2508 [Methylomagnum ishizawai]|uniref:DNA-binding protein n=1 Tax=Methylomagnum ishizawai TaxID=1760988 RepID=A0A1Y6D3P2_9GAMM|nr:hypothetical protein [Methylomagnum ishizawai]SMF95162.1 hypothetical protein SAMN02949497_2508 [Methylomagnum ishizawai]
MQFNLSTEAFASQLNIKPQSIRARVCRTGSYFGILPKKLPNGRLLWPSDASERLLQMGDKPEGA